MAYFRFFHFSLKCGPYIIDPANPTNNLYDEVKCWPLVKKVAEETTQKPLLRHVRVSADWKSEEQDNNFTFKKMFNQKEDQSCQS